jgi:hypothetical protein
VGCLYCVGPMCEGRVVVLCAICFGPLTYCGNVDLKCWPPSDGGHHWLKHVKALF